MKRQLPKNVRQIGNVSDSSKIYVEDYVDTFFNQLCEKADKEPVGAFLVGEIVQEEEEDYIYVLGAIQMKEIVQKGKEIFINENTWKNACETCKQYFGNAEILGWFLASAGQALETNHNILKVHQKFFSREKSIFVLKDTREKEEKYFIHKYRDLMECGGHYIFYEKNVEMQDYMISCRKKVGMTPSEIIEDTVTKNFRSVVREKMNKQETKNPSKYAYVMSTFLVLVVLVIGITMINNYDKMKGVQDSLEELNQNVVDEEESAETLGQIVQAEGDELEDNSEGQTSEEEMPNVNEEGDTVTESENGVEPESDMESEGDQEIDAIIEEGDVYTVQKGDTLASISKKIYGDSSQIEAICKMNGLEDGNLIFIGQKLLLP